VSTTYIGGIHAVQALLERDTGLPREVLVLQGRADARMQALIAAAERAKVPLRRADRQILDALAPGLRHQGVLAAITEETILGDESLLETPATPERLILVLDGVQDPHNLGACLRSAEAAGVSAVLLPRDRASGVTPAVRKVAAGSAERVPVIAVVNLARSLEKLKALGHWVIGLDGEASDSLYQVELTGPLVLVLGAEAQGLRRLTRECCDRLVRIPMAGRVESLNVSVAAGICLFEARRQRLASR
jgi:23S rRNA (guanosine2251-2'-O)-methyltransferase